MTTKSVETIGANRSDYLSSYTSGTQFYLIRLQPLMADPLSITAGVISVATLAYASAAALCETISSYRDIPEILENSKDDIERLSLTISSLQQEVDKRGDDSTLTTAQKINSQETKPTLAACQSACDAFSDRIKDLMRHSSGGTASKRDRLSLQFHEKEIKFFQAILGSYKSTLATFLGLCTLYARKTL